MFAATEKLHLAKQIICKKKKGKALYFTTITAKLEGLNASR